jgi:large subunit ribosomal protein L6
MSRIGRNPIVVPADVTVSVASDEVTVKGPHATMTRTIPDGISLAQDGDTLVVDRRSDETAYKALHGLTRTLVANMVTGVTAGFSKDLEIVGVGYRCVAKGPQEIELALGFSHIVPVKAPDGITFEVPSPTKITVRGIDKETVGQVAADIRKLRKPEPYKGKGIRYAGEVVLRKAGKAAK